VGLVVNGEADIGIGDFTVTRARSEVVAFVDTIAISGYGATFYIFS
jgi:ABC-type amino acid transport substrate-binding protein